MTESRSITVPGWKQKKIIYWSKNDVSDYIKSLDAMKPYIDNFKYFNGNNLIQLTDQEFDELIENKHVCRSFKRKINQKKDECKSINQDDEKQNVIRNEVGLKNLGNTCYLNSTIQLLLHAKKFVNFFRNNINDIINTKDKRSLTLLNCWIELCKKTIPSTTKSIFSPHKFLNALSKIDSQWGCGKQEDSLFVLENILKVLDKQINQCINPYFDNINCQKEMIINNLDDSDLLNIDEIKLIKTKFIPNYNPNDTIIRELFDGILCEECICGKCRYHQKKYTPFRHITIALEPSIVILNNIQIYIPQKLQNQTIIMPKCELLNYCSIDTFKYKIQQYIYSKYNNWQQESPIKFSDIQIGIFKPSTLHNQNIDKMVTYLKNNNTCNDLTGQPFVVITFKTSTLLDNNMNNMKENITVKTIVMIHLKITKNNYEIFFTFNYIPQGSQINQRAMKSFKSPDTISMNQFGALFYFKNGFVEYNENYTITGRTRAILTVWIDLNTFILAQTHIKQLSKIKNDSKINQIQNVIEYIDNWGLILDEKNVTMKNYVFNALNSTFNVKYKYGNTKSHLFNNVSNALDEYLKSVVLDGKTFAMLCPKCDQYCSIVERRRKIMIAPQLLILVIDRCIASNGLMKSNHFIKYDIKGMRINGMDENTIYNLNGAVNHSGSLHGGHYTANVQSINNNKLWFYISDSCIRTISINSVMSNHSMILMYTKQ